MTKKLISLFLVLSMALSITACGDKAPDVTGRYEVVSAKWEDGSGTTDGEWIELKKGGKGTLYIGFEFDFKWKLNGENFTGTLSFLGIKESLDGTLENGVLSVQYGDVSYVFIKEGAAKPADTEAQAAGGESAAKLGDTAGSLSEAIGGSTQADSKEVLTGEWYGWVKESMPWGDHNGDFQDAWGYVNYDEFGNKYFEVYKDGDSQNAFFSMYIEDENTDTYIIPVIGNEDAWIIDTYLLEEEGQYFEIGINYDGSISFTYSYTRYDGNSGCMVEIFLRKDGVLWDEAFDTLPPRYDEYMVALTKD